jgi:two-component system CheB/CheR fusion protein
MPSHHVQYEADKQPCFDVIHIGDPVVAHPDAQHVEPNGPSDMRALNNRLQCRIEDLNSRVNEQANLLNNADIAALSLDCQFHIQWFTPAMCSLIGIPLQVGQSIRDLPLKFQDVDFFRDAELVIRDLIPRQLEVRTDDDRFYMRRTLPCKVGNEQIIGVVVTFIDTTERRDYERRQNILLAELQHRVKNILASVQAIGRMTHQRSTNLAEFWEAFQGRLMALATTQELLTRPETDQVSLAELVDRELSAQGARNENIRIGGPALHLTAKAAQNLALALHELTTNATKHGALTEAQGLVEVKWRIEDDRVRFEWIESGGPSVVKPIRRGFGTELMEKAIPYQLRGQTKLEYPPEGMRCTFDFAAAGNIAQP